MPFAARAYGFCAHGHAHLTYRLPAFCRAAAWRCTNTKTRLPSNALCFSVGGFWPSSGILFYCYCLYAGLLLFIFDQAFGAPVSTACHFNAWHDALRVKHLSTRTRASRRTTANRRLGRYHRWFALPARGAACLQPISVKNRRDVCRGTCRRCGAAVARTIPDNRWHAPHFGRQFAVGKLGHSPAPALPTMGSALAHATLPNSLTVCCAAYDKTLRQRA